MLSQQQSVEIIGLWHEFYGKVTELMEQRAKMHHGLQRLAHSGLCGQEFAEGYLQVRPPKSFAFSPAIQGCDGLTELME